MRINWEIAPLPGGGWAGYVDIPTGTPGEALRITRVDRSPGEAISEAVQAAAAMAGALDVAGIIDLGSIIPGILSTAADVTRMVTGRARRGEPMTSEATSRLPGGMARLAHVAAMRPGTPGPGVPPWMPGMMPGAPYPGAYPGAYPGGAGPFPGSMPYMPGAPWPKA